MVIGALKRMFVTREMPDTMDRGTVYVPPLSLDITYYLVNGGRMDEASLYALSRHLGLFCYVVSKYGHVCPQDLLSLFERHSHDIVNGERGGFVREVVNLVGGSVLVHTSDDKSFYMCIPDGEIFEHLKRMIDNSGRMPRQLAVVLNGGLIVSTYIVANYLKDGKPVAFIGFSKTTGDNEAKIVAATEGFDKSQPTLVIDNSIMTGATEEAVSGLLPNVMFIALYDGRK